MISDTYARLAFIRALSFLITGYVIARIMGQFRQQRASLQQANREMTHYATMLEQLTVSRERNRMARELHDTLAHTLSGIAVKLEAAQSLWKLDADEAETTVGQALALTRSGLTETRRALHTLRASPLEDLGLALAIQNLALAAAERGGFKINWQTPAQLPKLAPDVEQGVYRIAQEIFENIVRHAGARQVSVNLTVQESLLSLSISDDGCGISPSELPDNGHYGLRGMRERAQMMGGELDIVSQPGKGTTIGLKIKE